MARARSCFLLGAAVWLAACAETAGPPVLQQPLVRADGQLRHLRWQPTAGPRQFSALGTTVVRRSGPNRAEASVVLDHHELAFWAFADRDQEIQINYQVPDGSWQPYVWFRVPSGGLSRRPDGTAYAAVDSVLITVAVDPVSLIVRFEPTGLEFSASAPARLSVWYTGADPDYDANGAVDGLDTFIEQDLLGVWVQELATNPWSRVTAEQSILSKVFTASLGHFSDYSVSW